MVEEAAIQYILFEYVAGWELDSGHPLAVLTLGPDDQGVRLYTSADWRAHVPELALPLIEETFADWKSLSPEEAMRSFPHLAQSSAGSLQAAMSGTCSYADLRAILKKELRIGLE